MWWFAFGFLCGAVAIVLVTLAFLGWLRDRH